MKLSGKLTKDELADVRVLVRPKYYWVKLALFNWYGALLVLVIPAATIAALFDPGHANWRGLGIGWAILIGIFGITFYRVKRGDAREFEALTAALPDWIILANDGLRFEGPEGAMSFKPWASYKEWQERKRAIVLRLTKGRGVTMLPIASLSETDREVLRGQLRSYISAHKD
jgi:hypothetical protein